MYSTILCTRLPLSYMRRLYSVTLLSSRDPAESIPLAGWRKDCRIGGWIRRYNIHEVKYGDVFINHYDVLYYRSLEVSKALYTVLTLFLPLSLCLFFFRFLFLKSNFSIGARDFLRFQDGGVTISVTKVRYWLVP